MPGPATAHAAPLHTGPYLSNWGPPNGPSLSRDTPGAIGVLADGDAAMPIGIVYPVGLVEHRRGPAQTFRLVIGKTELPGRWLWVGQRFVQLDEVAEELPRFARRRTTSRRDLNGKSQSARYLAA